MNNIMPFDSDQEPEPVLTLILLLKKMIVNTAIIILYDFIKLINNVYKNREFLLKNMDDMSFLPTEGRLGMPDDSTKPLFSLISEAFKTET